VGGTSLVTLSDGTYLDETGWSTAAVAPASMNQNPSTSRRCSRPATAKARTWPLPPIPAWRSTIRYDPPISAVPIGHREVALVSPRPCWAGLIVIANQIRATNKLGSLDGASQTLPALYSLPANDFHDITSGSNGGRFLGRRRLRSGHRRGTPRPICSFPFGDEYSDRNDRSSHNSGRSDQTPPPSISPSSSARRLPVL